MQSEELKKQKAHEYYVAHREEKLRYQRAYYLSHKEQAKANTSAHRKQNPEKYREYSRQQAARFIEMREEKAAAQSYLCPCGLPLGEDRALDHDHKCCPKTVRHSCRACDREVMHSVCNRVIGMLGEDPLRLRALADYLERHDNPVDG